MIVRCLGGHEWEDEKIRGLVIHVCPYCGRLPETKAPMPVAAKCAIGITPKHGKIAMALMELPQDSAARKRIPIYSGLFKYFPDALAEVASVSYDSNEKHNGAGSPLVWSKDKSADHLDCIGRHLLEAGGRDLANKNVRHSAQLAWRALANLQIEIEQERAAIKPATT